MSEAPFENQRAKGSTLLNLERFQLSESPLKHFGFRAEGPSIYLVSHGYVTIFLASDISS